MFIDEDDPSHWRVVVNLGRAARGEPRRRTVKVLFGTLSDALAARTELQGQRDRRELRPQAVKAPETVDGWMEFWLETYKRRKLQRSSFRRYQNDHRLYISPVLGRLKLKRLSDADIQRFYNALGDRGLSSGTILQAAAVLKQALNRAVLSGVIPRNPMAAAEAPRAPRLRELVMPDEEQVRQLLRVMEEAEASAYAATRLALASGLREGELIALEWSAVDTKAGVLRVRRSAMRVPSEDDDGPAFELVFNEPKTPKSRRTVALDPVTTAWLREHKRHVRAVKLQLRPNRWTDKDGDLVLPCLSVFAGNLAGRAWDSGTLRKAFQRYAERVGLGHLRFHDLRHIYASRLLRRGVPLKVVSEMLGHEKIATTADTYGHVLEEQLHEAAATLTDLWGETAPSV